MKENKYSPFCLLIYKINIRMRARLVEAFSDESDPIKDMNIGLGDLVPLLAIFPTSTTDIFKRHYTYFHKLIKEGYIIGVTFEDKVMTDMYKELNELLVPFFQNNTLVNRKGEHYWGEGDVPKNKKEVYKVKHMYTRGRHDTKDKIYKEKKNNEYHFFLRGNPSFKLAFIISKSSNLITLCFEGECPTYLNKYFTKEKEGSDRFLGEWKSPKEIVELVKTF